MGEFLSYSFRGKEGLRRYLKYFGLSLGVLFLFHIILLIAGIISVNFRSDWKNIYESAGAAAAGIIFGIVLYDLIKISLHNGTSRVSILVGSGAAALTFGALSSVMIEAVYLITDGIFRLAGMRLDCIIMCDDRHTWAGGEQLSMQGMNDLLAHDPRFIFFSISEIFLLVMLGYTAVMVFLAVKQRTNLFVASIASAVTAYCYFNLFIDYDGSVTLRGQLMTGLRENMVYIGEILHPDPMAPDQYGSCLGAVIAFLTTALMVFMIGYLVYAVFILRVPAAERKRGVR
ncbi:hypothetical protein [Ruminococcus albus]|uniref:Uncharacterized protein n=1 Tax=Ruminococcus albus TaxID=1264 RepID=A0A1I1E040_RUMAL|nr:hypothetical protein [Ruminococcus albus]SFB80669.1 hypothetical protein SAMN02910406_00596 [Ruminococcus albus]